MLKRSIFFIFLILLSAAVIGCNISGSGDEPKKEDKAKEASVEEESVEDSNKDQNKDEGSSTDQNAGGGKGPVVVIETDKGNIVFEMYPEVAPKTVDNFVTLANKGFYNGLKWHRVVPGFVIQGGDPQGTGMGGPGYTVDAEFNDKKHVTGTVAMARSQNINSAGSQFYICLAPQPGLDDQYTIFGQVTEGLDVIPKIVKDDLMNKVYIKTE